MSSTVIPHFRNVITDIFGTMGNFQQNERCAVHELRVVDCLEAYGVYHSRTACHLLIEDFRECVYRSKQHMRVRIMREERNRQVSDGERAPEDKYAPPPAVVD